MKKIKVGMFGVGARGRSLIEPIMMLNCDIVAICESKERQGEIDKALEMCGKNVAVYHDFDEFLNHGFDAVILANYFHEHTPYAIRCFEKGVHVYSECIANSTMAEGVALIRAFEKSKSIYMLAENYPQMLFNLEIQRVVKGGTLGKILYAEGEYNHPVSPSDTNFRQTYVYFDNHWRNFTPGTYYVTHSLGPLMRATGATPKKVSVFECLAQYDEQAKADLGNRPTAIITTQNDDGSIFRFTGCSKFGGQHNAYRVCGTRGQIENMRSDIAEILLRYNSWNVPEGMETINRYIPEWTDKDKDLIEKSGHGGSDFVTLRMFFNCVREGKQPERPFDVYSAVSMSSVAILGHRSMLNGGQPIEIPDFTKEEQREKYENDNLTPYYGADGSKPTVPVTSKID